MSSTELKFETTEEITDFDSTTSFKVSTFKTLKNMKTLKEHIGDNFIDIYDYQKHDGGSHNKKTGRGILDNLSDNLGIVDCDVPHDLSDEKKEQVRERILETLPVNNISVKTGNGGLHIYCRHDEYPLKNNRQTKAFKFMVDDVVVEVDLFAPVDKEKRSLIVFPPSRINDGKDKYEFIHGSLASKVRFSMKDIIDTINDNFDCEWKPIAEEKQVKAPKPIIAKSTPEQHNDETTFEDIELDKETIQILVAGIKDFEIHNYTNPGDKGDNECSLLLMFKAINCISDEDIREEAYMNCREICTEEAKKRFLSEKKKHAEEKSSLSMLLKLIKIHNPDYYKTYVLPRIGGIHIKPFDLNDDFDLDKFQENAEKNKYKTLSFAASDISRIYRYHSEGEDYFIEKGTNDKNMKIFRYVKYETVHRKLSNIFIFERVEEINGKKKNVKYTAWDAFLKYKRHFNFNAIKFNSKQPKVINYFHGYKWRILDDYDETLISDTLKLIKEGIVDEQEDVYEYVLNWISLLLQKPGTKIPVSIVLKGNEGAGKNAFTDLISYLTVGYSQNNVTRIEELTGQFNAIIENCMFMVLNEMKSARDEYIQNVDCLKSIITDSTIRVSEKFEPARTIENVCNFIFVSNHSKPLIIPPNDRRYLVLNVNGKFRNTPFLTRIRALTKEKYEESTSFYENLLTFFMKRDISKFNPIDIPMTDAKRDIIEASRTPVEDFIVENYNKFSEGFRVTELLDLYQHSSVWSEIENVPSKNFILQLKDKCMGNGRFQKKIGGKNVRVYKLKDEYLDIYKPESDD